MISSLVNLFIHSIEPPRRTSLVNKLANVTVDLVAAGKHARKMLKIANKSRLTDAVKLKNFDFSTEAC